MDNTVKDYEIVSLDEYFKLAEEENQKRSKMIAKSLTKYLKKSENTNKFAKLMDELN